MATEQELRGNMPHKEFDELVKALKDEYGITYDASCSEIPNDLRGCGIMIVPPQHVENFDTLTVWREQKWPSDKVHIIPLPFKQQKQ